MDPPPRTECEPPSPGWPQAVTLMVSRQMAIAKEGRELPLLEAWVRDHLLPMLLASAPVGGGYPHVRFGYVRTCAPMAQHPHRNRRQPQIFLGAGVAVGDIYRDSVPAEAKVWTTFVALNMGNAEGPGHTRLVYQLGNEPWG